VGGDEKLQQHLALTLKLYDVTLEGVVGHDTGRRREVCGTGVLCCWIIFAAITPSPALLVRVSCSLVGDRAPREMFIYTFCSPQIEISNNTGIPFFKYNIGSKSYCSPATKNS